MPGVRISPGRLYACSSEEERWPAKPKDVGSIPTRRTGIQTCYNVWMAYKDKLDPRARQARMKWYRSNKAKQVNRQKERRHETRAWMRTLKVECSKCSESHVACLQFHHEDPSEKEFNIGAAITNGLSKDRILKEIEKCVVLCANCHAKEHWNHLAG